MLSINKLKHLAFILLPLLIIEFTPCQASIIIQAEENIYTKSNDVDGEYEAEQTEVLSRTKKRLKYFKNDTLKTIKSLIYQSDKQKDNTKYSDAFDLLWEALFLATEENAISQESLIHRRLAKLYEIFKIDDAAMEHLEQSLSLAQSSPVDAEEYAQNLIGSYMNLALRQRLIGNYNIALTYLDSCYSIRNQFEEEEYSYSFSYLDAEKGKVYLQLNKLSEAETFLMHALADANKQKPGYLANIYLYLGELKLAMKQTDAAIYYFNMCIKFIKQRNQNNHLLPEAQLELSEIYKNQRRYLIAYNLMRQSKEIGDSLMQQQNSANSELFEIKNSYLNSLKEKDEFIDKQVKELKFQQQIQSRLKIIIGLALLLGITGVLIVRMRLRLKKTMLQKKNTELESKLFEKQTKAEIEVKSKELTSYALQMIDKDAAIDELLEILKKEAPKSYKPLEIKYKKGSNDLWDAFNLRFTEVNSVFYDRLNEKYPDLSPTEQKHCALIKLNFGTKEMARILNIAPHSVHISRSRIRKKMKLERAENLEKHIASL